ncbi:MAG TPA: hypothetical protein VJ963_11395, partial [Bacteroidales bacterium]|nr:hypothetical protein [Bacteroidales bacterium]
EPNRMFIIRMQKIKLQDIEDRVTKLFDDDAPPNLYFHNVGLLRNITNHVELLATAEKLPEEDFINLKIASVFYLTGYITDYETPMDASLRLVDEILPEYGFSNENVDITKQLITNVFKNTGDALQDNILHDAVYDYLGRVDYVMLTEKLLRERMEYGKQNDMASWIEEQKKMLADHEFKTATGRLLRSIPAADQLQALLESMQTDNPV